MTPDLNELENLLRHREEFIKKFIVVFIQYPELKGLIDSIPSLISEVRGLREGMVMWQNAAMNLEKQLQERDRWIEEKDKVLLKIRNYSHSEFCETEDQCCDEIENCTCAIKDCAEALAIGAPTNNSKISSSPSTDLAGDGGSGCDFLSWRKV